MRRAIFVVSVDGADVTNTFEPILISLTIKDSDGGKADTLECELDDTDGQIELPRMGAKITAGIGWSDSGTQVNFEGTVDEVRSTGGRGQGHVLSLNAKSADMRGKLKQPLQKHKDKSKFKDTSKSFGKLAGLSDVKCDDDMGAIERPYWAMGNEHFLHWGTRIAKELGATFKIIGTKAVFVKRSSGQSASGKPLSNVTATFGDNIISWSLSPIVSRPEYAKFNVRWYDKKKAKWMQEQDVQVQPADSSSGSAKPALTHKFKHATKDNASRQAKSNAAEADRDHGGGQVTIDGAPHAQSEASCVVMGIRPGIDGVYRVETATHKLVRGQGYTTELDLKQPSGAAGNDSRATPSSSQGA